MADSQINTGNLRNLTTSIKKDTEKMNELYKITISRALEACKEDLVVSGINFDDIQTSFQKLFASLVAQLNEFTDAMETKILPSYEATASSLARLFNQDSANEMNDYIKIINSD